MRLVCPKGLIPYTEGLRLQREAVKLCTESNIDSLILLEHAPCYTAGRKSHGEVEALSCKLKAPIVAADRGGQITYHGPGQLVAYPIINIAKPEYFVILLRQTNFLVA